MNRARLALVGVGGFGARHVACARRLAAEGLADIAAFAEPRSDLPAARELEASGARAYVSFEELLAKETALDLVCVATPIHTHVPIAAAVFDRGLHVFLEKPPAVRIQDLRRLIELAERRKIYCAVGFHDMARPEIIALKRRLCEGKIGHVRSIRGHARWRRTDRYYTRAPWAGRVCFDGAYVLDGPMNNSCAHMLNMAAYLAGGDLHEFARPLWVQGELYRAAPVQGEDTNCIRAGMDTGVEVCIHLTQAASQTHPRVLRIIGDKGEAVYHDEDGVRLPDEKLTPAVSEPPTGRLIRRLIEVIHGTDEPLLMPLAESVSFLLMSNGAYESAEEILAIPKEYVRETRTEQGLGWVISDIETAMEQAAFEGQLLSEYGMPWARHTSPFDLAGYTEFPQQWQSPCGPAGTPQ